MQIGVEGIENLLVIIVLKKKNLEKHEFEKTSFHFSLLGNRLNRVQFRIIQ
jgi:hypothetical protein